MPEHNGKNQGEDIPQSKRARAGSLAIVGYPQVARTCILRANVVLFFSGVTFVLLCFVFVFFTCIKAAAVRSIVTRYVCTPVAIRSYLTTVSSFLFFLFFFCGDVAFAEYFCTILLPFSLCVKSTSIRFFPSGCVFLPCDNGLDFDISLCDTSINQ